MQKFLNTICAATIALAFGGAAQARDKGYTVEVTEFSEWAIAVAAMPRGDIEIMASQTDYVSRDYWIKNINALEKVSPVSHGHYQAFAVPSYVDIARIEDRNSNAEKFGGKIIGIEPGSG